jgi:predicted enzyme related to lactoylglutathione lyase
MLTTASAFNGFSTDDIAAARSFYRDTLGVPVVEEHGMLTLTFADGHTVLIYPKTDHVPATYTVLNFPVADIDETVAGLRGRGIQFENYPWTVNGIQRGGGPAIAWFKDPAGNILSVLEQAAPPPAIGSIILASPDPGSLRAWYTDMFQVESRDGFLGFGPVGLMITGRDEITGPALEPTRVLVNLHVEDAAALVERLEQAGVTWVARSERRPDGTFATFADPDGNHVQIIEFVDSYFHRRAEPVESTA